MTAKKTGKVLFVLGALLLLAGCGRQNRPSGTEERAAVVSGDAVSDSAVSGSAVSGSAVQKKETVDEKEAEKVFLKKIKNQPYANEFHIFEGDKIQGIYQYSRTGKEEKFYETGLFSCPDVVWVDNECILYFCDYDVGDKLNQLYYAPLAGGKKKKQILLKQKVMLAEAEVLYYFIAKRGDEVFFCGDQKLCRVNIKTRKIEELIIPGQISEMKFQMGEAQYCKVLRGFNGQPCIQDDKAYLVGEDHNIYELDLEQFKARKLGEKVNGDSYYAPQIALDQHALYFGMELDESDCTEIEKVSLDTGEKTVLLTRNEIKALAKKYGSKKFDEKSTDVYGYVIRWSDKLYFVLSIMYDSEDFLYEEENLVFHCSAEDGSGVTFEKELADYEKKEIRPYLEWDMEDTWKMRNGSPVSILGENQFVIEYTEGTQHYDKKTGTVEGDETKKFILYDTETKQATKIREGTAAYGFLRASGYEIYEAYEGSHF